MYKKLIKNTKISVCLFTKEASKKFHILNKSSKTNIISSIKLSFTNTLTNSILNKNKNNKSLSILIVTPVYPPFVSVGGGVAITVSYLLFLFIYKWIMICCCYLIYIIQSIKILLFHIVSYKVF